jgi:hypothetical protein
VDKLPSVVWEPFLPCIVIAMTKERKLDTGLHRYDKEVDILPTVIAMTKKRA